MRWLVVLDGQCEYDYLTGPHRHGIREDGTLGVIVERLPAAGVYVPGPGDVIAGMPANDGSVMFDC